jgi:iron complex outermembrane receptor protein
VTKEIEGFDFTLGVSNLFDKRPPRVSVLNGGVISTLGQAAAVSQYDWLGRRFFVNVSAKLGRGARR